MSKINSKHDLIDFFESGCKKKSQLKIGVENEKFIFENDSNKRVDFKTISSIMYPPKGPGTFNPKAAEELFE